MSMVQLTECLTDPGRLDALTLSAWNHVIRLGRVTKLLPRLAVLATDTGSLDRFPSQVRTHLTSAKTLADRNEALMRWELRRIAQVVEDLDTPIVLLKGAAYLAAELPTSRGRIYADTDILVHRTELEHVEAIFKANDWEMSSDPLDEEYFRRWMHEVPPMQHRYRGTTLDLHHSIIPPTDTLKLDPELLFAETVPIPIVGSTATLYTLSRRDMILHSATHLFRNGDFHWGLRDLHDLDGMLRQFAVDDSFWERLLERATQLDLGLPLFCGLRFTSRWLKTPVPEHVVAAVDRWRPGHVKLRLLDTLVNRALDRRPGYGIDHRNRRAVMAMSYWPLPRWAAIRTPLFWLKRLPTRQQENA